MPAKRDSGVQELIAEALWHEPRPARDLADPVVSDNRLPFRVYRVNPTAPVHRRSEEQRRKPHGRFAVKEEGILRDMA